MIGWIVASYLDFGSAKEDPGQWKVWEFLDLVKRRRLKWNICVQGFSIFCPSGLEYQRPQGLPEMAKRADPPPSLYLHALKTTVTQPDVVTRVIITQRARFHNL